jgi:hypothetical protein
VDEAGNAYISGATLGSLGGRNAGALDVFLSKFDPSGNLLWSQQIGTPSNDQPGSVVVDESGVVYISGFTQGDFGAGNGGGYDVFLAKFVPQPLSGDFNNDGTVNAADYVVWRKGFSSGTYSEDDYTAWQQNFGAPAAGAAAGAATSSGVLAPEPTGATLCVFILACFAMKQRFAGCRCGRLHTFHNLNSEQVQRALDRARGEVAQSQPAHAQFLSLRPQHRSPAPELPGNQLSRIGGSSPGNASCQMLANSASRFSRATHPSK